MLWRKSWEDNFSGKQLDRDKTVCTTLMKSWKTGLMPVTDSDGWDPQPVKWAQINFKHWNLGNVNDLISLPCLSGFLGRPHSLANILRLPQGSPAQRALRRSGGWGFRSQWRAISGCCRRPRQAIFFGNWSCGDSLGSLGENRAARPQRLGVCGGAHVRVFLVEVLPDLQYIYTYIHI